jgi:VWFA-related protein
MATTRDPRSRCETEVVTSKLAPPVTRPIVDMESWRLSNRVFFGMCLAACILAIGASGTLLAQIVPGQLPPAGPPKPGQLADDPNKPAKDKTTTPDKDTSAPPEDTAAGGDQPTFHATVRRVVVPTTVLDPDGHGYVTGLKATDFELYDNNKPQKIEAELIEQPLSVVLAVQANSEVEEFLPKLRQSATLLHGLVTGTEGDVAVLAFDHRMLTLQDFTTDPDKLDNAMQHLRAGSSQSAIIDAILEGDHMLKHHDPYGKRRRVIILVSRDINKGSQAKMPETIRQMQFDNVIVYCVDISKALSAFLKKPDYPRPANGGIPAESMPAPIAGGAGPHTQTADVQQMDGNALNGVQPILRSIHDLFKKTPAEAFTYFTGGRVYNFATEHGLEKAISDIGQDLNSQYVLSYSPREDTKDEPGFHNIRVTVDRPGLQIRTRPGYWWGGGQIQ